ncbi:DUF4268 domain-containing protein [Phormidium sp. FACHB-1136]|uniref:DUF4268 domain-containing protein n=1 Tax=Phormidium sp. FACHB-1136 TaxID=2692848 RepID=UPI0016893A1A|nr:DUF4268 domain-containing protein [Phormidium sp. FACHB-1136]MBD2425495.1 DUF4268 domain-containing protein [Phormidium sp. FACHB-1136]
MRPKQSAKPKLGRLEKINPADYWQNAADFQHWLAEAENLELLSDALGLALAPLTEGDAAEADTETTPEYGLFQDAETDQIVLVAVYPGATETHHIGHLITGAALAEAETVVWVAAEFTAEHQQTLDWLNQLGQDQVNFLGVEVELWCIGKNAMAVNFTPLQDNLGESDDGADDRDSPNQTNVAAEPEPEPEPEPLTDAQQANLDFWTGLCEQMDRLGSLVKPGNPTPETTMGFAIARAGFRLNAILDLDHRSLYTELLLSGIDAHAHFYLLAHEGELIADDIGLPLIWDDSGDQTCVIACVLENVDFDHRDHWPHYQAWFCDCLERFYEAFFERIKQLDANGYHATPRQRVAPLTDALILPASQRN